ncbi:hypothetical protein TUMEXPCC7403_25050 [Tumidithrix helvetica PCC 7403]
MMMRVTESRGRIFKTCGYDCLGYGAVATFLWSQELPRPESFDGLFPNIPPGYPEPNISRNQCFQFVDK